MDLVAFATWLLGVRYLDASQRGRAFQELALAEEHDTGSSHKGIAVAAMTAVEAEAVPLVVRAGVVNAASGQDLLSQIGQGRLASFGCPHCGGDDIRPWGKASGKPRYRYVRCRKTFNPLTGMPLAGLHYPDRWQDQARALISRDDRESGHAVRGGLYDRVPMETPVPGGSQPGQAHTPVRDRRGRRDVCSGVLQGQAPRAAEGGP